MVTLVVFVSLMFFGTRAAGGTTGVAALMLAAIALVGTAVVDLHVRVRARARPLSNRLTGHARGEDAPGPVLRTP
jgi:hypothetical protein